MPQKIQLEQISLAADRPLVSDVSFTLRRACLSSEQGRYHILVTPTLSDSWKEQLHQLQELTSDKVLVMTPELLHQSDDEQTDKEGKSA